jgi:DNA-binding CsgD family transcriptional regulator
VDLRSEEKARVQAVVEVAAHTDGLADLIEDTLAAMDEHLGFGNAAFMLTLSGHTRAYSGALHGWSEPVLEEYFERWAGADPLGSPMAVEDYAARGWTSIEGIYESLQSRRRLFVDDFLRRMRMSHQVATQLPGAHTDGYLTVMGAESLGTRDRLALAALTAPLNALLQERLPRGFEGVLSERQAEVAELVALGFTNRDIGELLNVEEDTVKKHVSHALRRLSHAHRTELAVTWATGKRLAPPLRAVKSP